MNQRIRLSILGSILLLGAILRFWPSELPYCELDGAIYSRTATELADAWRDGSLWRQPFTGEHYSSVDYWPLLFPLFSAFLGGTYAVSAGAGTVAIWFVYSLARSLFRECPWKLLPSSAWPMLPKNGIDIQRRELWAESSALLAAAIAAFHPYLVWFARVPRSETLYMLWIAIAAYGLLGNSSSRWRWIGGGISLALAYATRFEGLLIMAVMILAAGYLRGRKCAGWGLLGVVLGCAPYWSYLAWLNGGVPTLVTPHKAFYDALEGICTRAYNWSIFEFSCRFGVPGIFSVKGCEAEVERILQTRLPSLIGYGITHIPDNLRIGNCLWIWLAWPLLMSCAYLKDRRWQVMAALCLPSVVLSIFQCWDIVPRYYAFSLLPLAIMAAKGWEGIALWKAPRAQLIWVIVAVLIPLWLGIAWVVPEAIHFDQRGVIDGLFLTFLPEGQRWRMLSLSVGFGTAALALWRYPARWCGFLGTALAWGTAGGAVLAAWEGADSAFSRLLPGTLLVLICAPMLIFATMPAERWGRDMWRWSVALWILAAWGSVLTLEEWSSAHSRILYSPQCGEFLHREAVMASWSVPEGKRPGFGNAGPRVLAMQQIDALRSGARWLPWIPEENVISQIEREQPDYIVAAIPEPLGRDELAIVHVPSLLSYDKLEQVAVFPVAGGNLRRQWRVYKLRR